MKMILSSLGERTVILQAMRDIVPFEQMPFDHGDKVAQALIDDNS